MDAGPGQRADPPGIDHRGPGSPRRSRLTWFLRIPLFYKLILANGAIVVGVALASGLLAARVAASHPVGSLLLVTGVGVVLILVATGTIVWVALSPLRDLEQTAARVRAGDEMARTALSPVADADLERIVLTFNESLDAAADRSRRLREVAARAEAATEEERRRVARELHDGIAQSLAALNIRVKLARRASDAQLRESVLEEVSGGIGDAILELRRIARGLRPPALEMLGLAAAMESHARTTGESAGIVTDISVENVAGSLGEDMELGLYRILQESLSNVVRHSGASRVAVELRRNDRSVELIIADDGRGFDPVGVRVGDRGLGLFGMEERAASMGGRLEIHSRMGRGTRVVAAVPVLEE